MNPVYKTVAASSWDNFGYAWGVTFPSQCVNATTTMLFPNGRIILAMITSFTRETYTFTIVNNTTGILQKEQTVMTIGLGI